MAPALPGPAPSPVYLAGIAAVQAFLDELGRTFRDGAAAAAWVDRPAPALQGRTARDLIRAGHVDRVTGLLYAVSAGVFA